MAYVVVAFMVVVFVLSIYRLRRGGPGPAVNWIPRRMRSEVNSAYEHEDWQKPYDEQGNRSSDTSPL